MSSFNSLAETRKLGAPVVRLFRVALGRDPDPIELQRYASRLRQGAALHDLATDMTRSIEFRRLMGCDSNADAAFVARIAANALPEGPTREAARVALQAAAELGMNQGDLVGMLSDSPPGRDNIPLFPGLAPGASPEDTTAYRLWIEEYDSPVEADLYEIPPVAGPRITISMAAGDVTVEGSLRSLEKFSATDLWQLGAGTHESRAIRLAKGSADRGRARGAAITLAQRPRRTFEPRRLAAGRLGSLQRQTRLLSRRGRHAATHGAPGGGGRFCRPPGVSAALY